MTRPDRLRMHEPVSMLCVRGMPEYLTRDSDTDLPPAVSIHHPDLLR